MLHSSECIKGIVYVRWPLIDLMLTNGMYQEMMVHYGGGGGVEHDQILDIRPPKISNIRYQTPENIKYQISRVRKNQISGIQKSDIRPPKKINYQISHPLKKIKYQISWYPRSTPPPPPLWSLCIIYLKSYTQRTHKSLYLYIIYLKSYTYKFVSV